MKYAFLFLVLALSCQTPNRTQLQEKIKLLESDLADMSSNNEDATGFIHTVYFWMKDDVSDEAIKDFEINGLLKLAKVSSIHKLYYGPPANTTRDVVDNTYDYAWICHFKSSEDEEAYQVDPLHIQFIEDYNHLWEKVIVYDNLLMQNSDF